MSEPVDNTATIPKAIAEDSAPGAEAVGKSAFLEKVCDIPVVQAAKGYGTAAYNQVKEMNTVTKYTLNKAENTLLYFALSARPYLEKVEPQAKFVDGMACRGLQVFETKAPFMFMPPEKMVEEARKLCSLTIQTGYQKVDDVKNMGSGALSSVKNYGMKKASDCLADTEDLVNKYLPPAFGESSKEEPEIQSLTHRATHLTVKVGQRVYDHGLKHFLNVQKFSQESISRVAYTIELLQQLKENASGKTLQDYVEEARVKATWIWDELKKEPATAGEANKSLEQRMLSLARRITSTLVHTYSSIPLTNLPQACIDSVRTTFLYAADLFNQLDQATLSGEAAPSILQRALSTVASLEAVVKNIVDSVQASETEMQDLSSEKASETEPSEQGETSAPAPSTDAGQ